MTCYKLSTNSTTDWSQPPIGRYTSPILIYPHPHPPPENQKTETCLWNRSEINKHAMFRRCNGRVSFVAKKKKLSGREYVIYMDSSYFRTMQHNLIFPPLRHGLLARSLRSYIIQPEVGRCKIGDFFFSTKDNKRCESTFFWTISCRIRSTKIILSQQKVSRLYIMNLKTQSFQLQMIEGDSCIYLKH